LLIGGTGFTRGGDKQWKAACLVSTLIERFISESSEAEMDID
jgi:hypothetical protein